jgi:hypothetical protein
MGSDCGTLFCGYTLVAQIGLAEPGVLDIPRAAQYIRPGAAKLRRRGIHDYR